jgi:hypothetical protein
MRKQPTWPADINKVPLHLRPLHRVGKQPESTWQHSETHRTGRLFGTFKEHLHADTDAKKWTLIVGGGDRYLVESALTKGVHARAKRADTGENDSVGVGDESAVSGESRIGSHALKRFLR